MNEHRSDKLFDTLEPPAGGLAGLRSRLARQRRVRAARAGFGWTAAVATPMLLALAIWISGGPRQPSVWDAVSPEALVRELVPEASAPVSVPEADRNRFALQAIVETEQVVYYRFASLTAPAQHADPLSTP